MKIAICLECALSWVINHDQTCSGRVLWHFTCRVCSCVHVWMSVTVRQQLKCDNTFFDNKSQYSTARLWLIVWSSHFTHYTMKCVMFIPVEDFVPSSTEAFIITFSDSSQTPRAWRARFRRAFIYWWVTYVTSTAKLLQRQLGC